uniref:Saposin B-type domain-containing protein n=1 Tax=Elaeophora elaphi TaxID=1147741 RepID=A0A0R3RIU1_9BILA
MAAFYNVKMCLLFDFTEEAMRDVDRTPRCASNLSCAEKACQSVTERAHQRIEVPPDNASSFHHSRVIYKYKCYLQIH